MSDGHRIFNGIVYTFSAALVGWVALNLSADEAPAIDVDRGVAKADVRLDTAATPPPMASEQQVNEAVDRATVQMDRDVPTDREEIRLNRKIDALENAGAPPVVVKRLSMWQDAMLTVQVSCDYRYAVEALKVNPTIENLDDVNGRTEKCENAHRVYDIREKNALSLLAD